MELVYLWVEDYKNIQKQGFNFSPRFDCEYDEESKKLEVIDKEKTGESYLKNFFGNDIHITAIVGENGSGKSSITNFFEKIFFEKDIEKYLLISYIDKKLHIYSNFSVKNIVTNHEYKTSSSEELSLCSYNAEMPYPYEHRKKLHFKDEFCTINLEEKHIYKLMSSLIQRGENNIVNFDSNIFKPKNMTTTENIEYKMNLKDKIKSLINEDTSFKNIELNDQNIEEKLGYNKSILVDNIINELYANDSRYEKFLENEAEKEFEKDKERYRNNSETGGRQMTDEEILDSFQDEMANSYSSEKYIEDTLDKKELYHFFMGELNMSLYSYLIPSFIFQYDKDRGIHKELDVYKYLIFYKIVERKSLNEFLNFIINYHLNDADNSDINTVEDLIKDLFYDTNFNKIDQFSKEQGINNNINFKEFESLKSQKPNIDNKKYFEEYYVLFTFEFFDENDKKFSDLSHGEKIFYGQILNIYFYSLSNNIQNNLILCFDEPELSLHPMWQKEYLNRLIKFIETLDKKIHLIFTTHSPFLLSDLPKENVILLEKNKESGNCINVTNKVDLNPFGANIHTLLSHGFFMKDGLMGEFAKDKIDTAIKYLNQTKLSDKELTYCENIISIIGEPIIKRQLQKMLDSKRLSKIDEVSKKIKDMEYELNILKSYQKSIVIDDINNKAKKQYSVKFKKNDK